MSSMGWIGFDFDGTLATHESGQQSLGEPIAPMVELAKQYLAGGYEIRIVTARASHPFWPSQIKEWCHKHLGAVVEVTDKKDWGMLLLYDDRAIAVEPNTGRLAGFRL
jgi:FMN phosphatase YigB (HAD superfamily)